MVHLLIHACKRLSHEKQLSTNNAVLGECGRYPLTINGCASYICQFLVYHKSVINMLCLYDSHGQNQLSYKSKKDMLCSLGSGSANVCQPKDKFQQMWYSDCSNSRTMSFYSQFKPTM